MNSKPRRVCVVITARSSYARIRTALEAMKAQPDIELQLVVGASVLLSRCGNALDCIRSDGFEIDAQIYNVVEGGNLVSTAKSTGIALGELATVFDMLAPDVVVSIADRFETLANAVAASYMNIPLAHIQGGEVTGNIDEKVRHAVTKLADLHLVSTPHAAENVIRMGEPRDRVFVSGCPSVDLAKRVAEQPALDFDPIAKYGGVGPDVDIANGYIVALQHPVTTEVDAALTQVTETLEAAASLPLPVLWFWPNVDAGSDSTSRGIRRFREQRQPSNIRFFKHMDSQDFLRLLINSRGIIGNSSVAIRECSFLGVPAVNIGNRQQGRDRGQNVIDVAHDRRQICQAIASILADERPISDTLYGDGEAGTRIADHLATAPLTIEKRLQFESLTAADAPAYLFKAA